MSDLIKIFNIENIKKLYYKNINNELLFNNIINNCFFLFGFLRKWFAYSNIDLNNLNNLPNYKLTCKSLSMIYNDKKIVLITYLLDNNDIKYIIKGVNYESADGEFRPSFSTYDSFKLFETYYDININIFYKTLLDSNFFSKIKIFYEDKESLNIQDFTRSSIVILQESLSLLGYGSKTINNLNIHFKNFLLENIELISFLLLECIEINNNYLDFLVDFILDYTSENIDLCKTNHRLIAKIIPSTKAESYIRELNISFNVSNLKYNNVTDCVPITYSFLKLKNYTFSNINILKFIYKSKIILDTNLYKNTFSYYLDNILDNMDFNIISRLNQLQKDVYLKDNEILLIMEYVGDNLSSLPNYYKKIHYDEKLIITDNKNISKYDDKLLQLILKKLLNFTNKDFNIKDLLHNTYIKKFDNVLFEIIYTLLCLNKKINLIHNDLHLNNITYRIDVPLYYTTFNELSEIEKILDEYIKLHNIKEKIYNIEIIKCFYNIYSLSNNNKNNNSFIINTTNFSLNIIDFSRAILCEENSIFELLELIYDIFPFIKKDKTKNFTLIEYISDKEKFFIIFKIMSGYDVYVLFDNIYNMFTEEKKLNIPEKKTIKLIKNIKDDSYKIMYKNLMRFLSNKDGKEPYKKNYSFTNEIILYKYFSNFLLKNVKKNDIINSPIDKKNLIIDVDIIKEAFFKNKKIIINHYNIENDIIYNNVSDMVNNVFNLK